ncbi:photosystem reaction center subunit H [Desulfosporosinus sp. HMP52]|uniref:PRC-barrel domain-containing protein n=1 Tax=Desulfosporosinus sp. HMP52 TaxID=1487923 RepID=UPI00051F8D54|nr:PRC-barrel domain-containing protein [Desulfosporosinus sp. HMP52]KGK89703.1 photosystem reaction center subunit H [Desulfosporosinus sp. HMP52]
MKATKVIIGLRVISISDGTQIGVVKDLVLNPQGKSLDFLIIDQPSDYFGAKVISYTDLLGVGEFAITIPNQDVIQDVAQNSEIQNLLKQDIRVIGTKVLTKKGQLIGEVREVIINEETGRIASCLFESDGEMQEIQAEKIITLGKELLIIEEESTPVAALGSFELNDELLNSTVTSGIFKEDEVMEDQAINNQILEDTNQEPVEEVDPQPDTFEKVDIPEERETDFNLFEQRQLQYFIGKKVDKDIILDNADILHAGEFITPEMVTHITTRSTLMEVTSHLQKN